MSNADFDTLHMTPRPGPAAHPSPAEPLKTPARGHPYASNPGRIATSRRSPTRQPPGPTSPKPQYLQAIHRQFSPPRGSLQKSHTPTADDRSARLRRSRPACASPRLQQRRRATAPPGCGSGTFPRLLRAAEVARSHDCRRGLAITLLRRGRATARRRERSPRPGCRDDRICDGAIVRRLHRAPPPGR